MAAPIPACPAQSRGGDSRPHPSLRRTATSGNRGCGRGSGPAPHGPWLPGTGAWGGASGGAGGPRVLVPARVCCFASRTALRVWPWLCASLASRLPCLMPFRASRLRCPAGHSRAFPPSPLGHSADLCSPAHGLGRPLKGAALGLGRGVLGGVSCPWPFENWEGENGLQRPREKTWCGKELIRPEHFFFF